jgi:hypothetical protein
MTTVFAFVGEHREDPDRLLLLGADGQLYEHLLPDGPMTPIEPDDQWTRDVPAPEPDDLLG